MSTVVETTLDQITPTLTSDPAPSTSTPTPSTPSPRSAEVTWEALDRCADLDHFGPTSPVLRPNTEWYNRGLLIPHSVIRFDLLLLERAVQAQHFQPQRKWKVKRLFHWYNRYFLNPTHHHHDTEESATIHWHSASVAHPIILCLHPPLTPPLSRLCCSSPSGRSSSPSSPLALLPFPSA